jgi:cytidyltransferase-like protein
VITVAASGGFDPLHHGHIAYLRAAQALGDRLVVLLDSDEFVSRKHPVLLPQEARAAVLAELRCVDLVLRSDGPDVAALLEALRPDVYAVGADHGAFSADFPELKVCQRLRIRVRTLATPRLSSSTQLLKEVSRGLR